MKVLLNMVWFILGGFISWATWFIVGILWCITIIGIPIGLQCFKMATMSAAPFGKEIEISSSGVSMLLNLIWLIAGGLVLAFEEMVLGLILCITIIGIPFGKQHFKHAKLALFPFGARIYRTDSVI